MGMELLAPAGSSAALRAAVQSGADAVYLGVNEFGARQSAENFSIDELGKWVDYCHLYGVDVHVTVNTLIKNSELNALANCVKRLNAVHVDALIVQDIGAADIIKNTVPDMTLHASTQMTVTSLEGVKYLENMGFSRVVLARELSRNEIEYICRNTDTEIEVFVHGAICMCYSGQCLMSSILGGRSGNRGRCAQPCRLPYELLKDGGSIGKGYLLSPKDMSLVNELDALKKCGVRSLKIEGRLKRPEYVSAVVGVYRKYLDSGKSISTQDMRELTDAFSRSGFTDGYFKNRLGADMMSHTSGNSAENKFTPDAVSRTLENANVRKIPVTVTGTLKKDSPLAVTISDTDGNSIYAIGTVNSETAVNRPLDKQRLSEQLLKLGQTPFECTECDVRADDGITIPIKEVNEVRRRAVQELIEKRCERKTGRTVDCTVLERCERENQDIILTAEVMTEEQMKAAVEGGIKRIYAPSEILKELKSVPKDIELVTKASDIFSEQDIETEAVLTSSPAGIYHYDGKKLYGDFRLNVFNSNTAEHFSGLEGITLSPELNIGEIRDILKYTTAKTEIIGYGHLPLMIMRNCPIKAAGKCRSDGGSFTLRDRKNEEFPLVCSHGCRSVLLNSKPIFTADKISDLTKLKINSIRLIFTVEKFSQCGKIIDVYKRAMKGEKIEPMRENTFTRGHLYRGVL